mmetsp:Transcript_37586/g.77191  ORF Transcript_37586/g.77191 Transcript_37586/m.77191 type:complete len:253 (-) Transcript_37586:319-1077(-)
MAGSCLMMALLRAMSCMARASEMVTTAGRPSGMMATAMETADLKASPTVWSCAKCASMKAAKAMMKTKTEIQRPKISSCTIKLVFIVSTVPTMVLMRPISAKSPVPITIPFPSPSMTMVAEKAKSLRSPSAASPATGVMFLLMGLLSPVSIASRHERRATSNKRTSAGTWSPALSATTSPGTSSFAGISNWLPSRMTIEFGASMFLMASAAFSAFPSCTKPILTLITTTAQIRATSFHSSKIAERMVAAMRM